MKKMPYGISNYEKIINDNYYYVDKTMYIEKLENIAETSIMFLRPRKFGKTLFTSTLEYYYDINAIDKFEKLFKNTYIGKNPSKLKNSYHILRFNFSGIDTSSVEATINGFKAKIAGAISYFVKNYGLDFYVNEKDEAENILYNLFKSFSLQKISQKIYVIIDEYDHFANELLGFHTENFKELVSKNGKIRKWYEMLKEGTETVVDRIFITGVAPITMDSTTSGFNIAKDLTKELEFNNILGFSKQEVIEIMNNLEISKEKQEKLLPIIKENYDGYVFSNEIEEETEKYRIYNSNMTLYFFNEYLRQNKIPENLLDTNIASDYSKIEGLLNICKGKEKMTILEKIVAGDPIESELTEKFNAEIGFEEKELVSLLYYLGYLTIIKNEFGILQFASPNSVIKKIYTDYYFKYIKGLAKIEELLPIGDITREIFLHGKIDIILKVLGEYLTNLSNRDYSKFSEKYVKVIFYTIARTLGTMIVKSEMEIGGNYSDIVLLPKENLEERYGVLLEFKYIKKEDYEKDNSLLKQKQEEAKEQIKRYQKTEEIKQIPKLKCYTVVVVKDKLFVEEI